MAAKAPAVTVAPATANDDGRRWLVTALITASAIAVGLAGLFTRLIDLDVWTVLFWRALPNSGAGRALDPSIWRLRPVSRGPLLGQRRQRLFLAGDALDRNGIDGDDVDPREEALGSASLGLAVFRHQGFAEPLLDVAVFDDPDPAEQAHASIGETRIAFEPAVVEDVLRDGGCRTPESNGRRETTASSFMP